MRRRMIRGREAAAMFTSAADVLEQHPYQSRDPVDGDTFFVSSGGDGRPPDRGVCRWNQAGGPQCLRTAFRPKDSVARRCVYRTFVCCSDDFSKPKSSDTRGIRGKRFEMRVYELHEPYCRCCACCRGGGGNTRDSSPSMAYDFRLVRVVRREAQDPRMSIGFLLSR